MVGTKEDFRQDVIQSIRAEYPGWQAEPKDEFAISAEVSGRNGCMNLDNLYHQVQLQREPKHVLIRHFLSEFARIIRDSKDPLGNFDVIKSRIELVVRPPNLYSECLGSDHDKQLAFCFPVLPDVVLYWIVDNANSWQYVANAQFSKWKVPSVEVTWWAYENICKAESCMNTADIGEIGLLISTNRKMGTISHLL